ncbi:MAG TPA: ECF-type sigma factor [Phycisphaerae bacterium]|nr:ECF-type sigma factor [Phycisphaerae bacterium]HRW53127.1 ECF-type sigma factor [Phycisphaerae bacterium]
MEPLSQAEYEGLLTALTDADRSSASRWLPEVYESLRNLAGSYIRDMGPQMTLQPTALVNEAYLRLADKRSEYWNGKTHFVAVAARAMRYVLVNAIRDRHAAKRGGDARRFTLAGLDVGNGATVVDIVALNDLLESLMTRSERQARVVELRVFGGLTIDEAADALGVSASTVKADWTVACAWLKAQL